MHKNAKKLQSKKVEKVHKMHSALPPPMTDTENPSHRGEDNSYLGHSKNFRRDGYKFDGTQPDSNSPGDGKSCLCRRLRSECGIEQKIDGASFGKKIFCAAGISRRRYASRRRFISITVASSSRSDSWRLTRRVRSSPTGAKRRKAPTPSSRGTSSSRGFCREALHPDTL